MSIEPYSGQEKAYRQQVTAQSTPIDLDYWRTPEGIRVPDDELRFLLVPDAVEAAAISAVAEQVHAYQALHRGSGEQIEQALIVTMGGMLPGILLHDHLVHGRPASDPRIEFGTVGVPLYQGPGVRYDEPLVQQEVSLPVAGKTVLLIDDLGDQGGTMSFLKGHLREQGAQQALNLVLYLKPAAKAHCMADFYFGETPQDTWIITPREQVETLAKRVPVWQQRGASEQECRRRLVDIIGFSEALVERYLPGIFARR